MTPLKPYSTPGARLRSLRKSLGWTQEEFGKFLGLAGYQIRDMESDKVEISTLLARFMSRVTGVDETWILKGTGAAPGELIVINEKKRLQTGVQSGINEGEQLAPLSAEIVEQLRDMTDADRQTILDTIKEKKLLRQLLRERQEK